MEENKKLFSIYKSESEKIKIILNNVLKMLGSRIYIDNDGEKQWLITPEDAKNEFLDKGDGVYTLRANNGEKFAIKIYFHKISSTGKQSIISDFLKEYGQYKKIVIASSFNNKAIDYMNKHQTQIFKESSLLFDIKSHIDQPKFELLSPSEMEQVKQEYNINDYTTNKYPPTDPIVRYFALRKGDIIRIIRPSPTSGEAINYRIAG